MKVFVRVSLAALAASLSQGTAFAQAEGSKELEEIVVTAQRRGENLQDVPITVTAVTANAARAAGIEGSDDIAVITPGVVITRTPGTQSIYIRGVGNPNGSAGEESSNAVYVDGVYYASLASSVFELNNIERLEVLKGPQGTLFGRNATGGLIQIITRDPSQDPTAQFSVGYGNYETVKASGYVSFGIAQDLAIDLAGVYTNQDKGFGVNRATGEEIYEGREYALRSKIKWDAGPDTTVRLSGDYAYENSSFTTPRTIIPGATSLIGATYLGKFYDVSSDVSRPFIKLQQGGATLRIDHDMSWAKLLSLSAYRKSKFNQFYDQDGTPAGLIRVDLNQNDRQFSQELQLQSLESSSIKWTVGLFYFDGRSAANPIRFTGTTQTPLGGFDNRFGTLTTKSYAAYAQVTVPLTSTLNVTGGLRYTKDERHLRGRDETGAPVSPIRNVVDAEKSFQKLTWRLSVDQKLGDDALIYASYNRGFKSGLFNTFNLTNPPIEPEVLDAFEIGVKSELFDRRLRANVSGFYYKYKDIQLINIVPAGSQLLNAASARVYGLDAELVAAPIENLNLRAGFNLLDAKYEDFPTAPGTIPLRATVIPPNYTCAAPSPTALGGNRACVVNAAGNRMTRAPKATFSVGGDYELPTEIGNFGLSVNYYHNSGFFFEPENRTRQKAYGLLNGQISWRSTDDQFGVRFWAKNLTNEKYYYNISVSLGDNGTPAPPKTYGFSLDAKF